MRYLLILFCALVNSLTVLAQDISIIPKPKSVKTGKGSYLLGDAVTLKLGPVVSKDAKLVVEPFESVGIAVDCLESGEKADIELLISDDVKEQPKESYDLTVDSDGISIVGGDLTGVFYGIQSLLQLMPTEIYSSQPLRGDLSIPHVSISDSPRFEWRGLLIDLSRHFFSKEVLKETIDRMALHKLNRLHLHLTDDPGWRLEIEQFPKLTEIGAIGNKSNPGAPAAYLSKADIRELVEYASRRFIEIVPEIDMPGHAGAAAKAYPEYFDGNITFNIGKPETYDFVESILGEVIELFPTQYIHFGGDELRNHRLEELPEVKTMMEQNGFKTIYELEGHFDRFVANYIASKGRIPMGWDEVAGFDIGNNAIIQWWRGLKPEARDYAIEKGYRVILSPSDYVYLDYPQSVGEPGAPWEGNHNGPNTLQSIYDWKMVPDSYSSEQEKQIIGIEAALWTEFIRSEGYFEFMTFPRLAAIAEVAWIAKGNRDIQGFEQRMEQQFQRYEGMGINYRIPVPGDPLGKNAGQYLTN